MSTSVGAILASILLFIHNRNTNKLPKIAEERLRREADTTYSPFRNTIVARSSKK